MKIKNYSLLVLFVLLSLMSCKKDDEGDAPTISERDRTEQQVIDRDSLLGYLETHYYNASRFDGAADYTISDIVISELPKDENGNYLDLPDPANNTLLIDDIETHTTMHEEVSYEYYILKLNQGGGLQPKFTDDVRLNYSGNLMDEYVFDSTASPTDLNLLNLIPGWKFVIPQFSTASTFTNNEDGTVSYSNYGLGVMFLPSGLAYFSTPSAEIPFYANLIFKFELFQTEENDDDADLIPSYIEDYNGDFNPYNEDTDEDGVPDFLDFDDDGDGVLTKYEDIDNDGDPTNDDTNGNGVPNYLDEDSTESNQDDD